MDEMFWNFFVFAVTIIVFVNIISRKTRLGHMKNVLNVKCVTKRRKELLRYLF